MRQRRIVSALAVVAAVALGGVVAVSLAEGSRQEGGLSPAVRGALLADAKRVAAVDGDGHPYNIEAVRTTHRRAEKVWGDESSSPPPNTVVYVIAMRGHFHCSACSHPEGATIPPGSVITLEIVAKTMSQSAFGLGRRYPNLRTVGIPVRL